MNKLLLALSALTLIALVPQPADAGGPCPRVCSPYVGGVCGRDCGGYGSRYGYHRGAGGAWMARGPVVRGGHSVVVTRTIIVRRTIVRRGYYGY